MFILWFRQLPWCGDWTPASVPPPTEGRSSTTNTLVSPPVPSSYWVLHGSIYSILLVRYSWLSGSWPILLAVPTSSPTLINSILLSFCLMFGNSFPICAWTTTFMIVDFPICFSLWVISLNHLHANDQYRLIRNQKKSNGDCGIRFPSIFRRDTGRDSIFSLWPLLCLDETPGSTTTIL